MKRMSKTLLSLIILMLNLAGPQLASAASLSSKNFPGTTRFGTFAVLDMSISQTVNFCIGVKGGNYTIEVRGTGLSGANFQLAAGAAQMPYSVEFAPHGSDFISLTPGIAVAATTATNSCSMNSNNVSLRLTLLPGDFNAAPVGYYSDTLTAIISDN